ncbi:MAG: twin-arginine translocation signal domain-containing protein, partial [Bdellovibrionales bacterium]|nr:twin-arginine translocation signal domain-containing protein [Bdellovibrionales bacterium]
MSSLTSHEPERVGGHRNPTGPATHPSRRDFLKTLGASTLAMHVAGCGLEPAERLVQRPRSPEYTLPGRAQFFASSLSLDGVGTGVLVESHEGRPTRVRGNDQHPESRGALDPIRQAAVRTLYDPRRAAGVTLRRDRLEDLQAKQLLNDFQKEFTAAGGRKSALLYASVDSPSILNQISLLRQQYPDLAVYVHSPLSRTASLEASKLAFGESLLPIYNLATASCVLAVDGDFLDPVPGQLAYAADFISTRQPAEGDIAML